MFLLLCTQRPLKAKVSSVLRHRTSGMSGNPAIRCLRHSAEAALSTVVKSLVPGAAVLDIGCQGWRPYRLAHTLGRADLRHAGCDCQEGGEPGGCGVPDSGSAQPSSTLA